ncbi:hypothetical protein GCM10010413_36550 [Promicromonospora sukumoe]|uniref:Uncharacterized protein n=1 Tax=Promicromonospora sukumoe TaxID=88382 RepID=A0A7W3PDJ0_9MICO|nr:hypothetical protein [Promicromonospora sukumoe]MBA8807597.1 hypothetical protein [Promicromonospora sukumoe]
MNHAVTQEALQHADIAALTAQEHADASDAHALISHSVWRLLHSLGAPTGGRAMAFGHDPQILLSGDPARSELRDSDGFPLYSRWQATVPAPGAHRNIVGNAVPISRYPLNLETAPVFEVAVASMQYNDIRLRSREARVTRHRGFHIQAAEALTALAPGGHAVLLANHSILDFPDPQPWGELARIADFLGAVRLPSYALRAARACDAPVDVLILRRRETPFPDPKLQFPGVQWSPEDGLHESTYFTDHPDRVLGTRDVGTDYWGMKQLAVHDPDRTWPGRLNAALDDIAHHHGAHSDRPPGPPPASARPFPWPSATRPPGESPGPQL